jgi:5'-nucleotidase / UDP-sugar diphosphatase
MEDNLRPLPFAGAIVVVLSVMLGLVSLTHPLAAQSVRRAVILSINDVYRIEGVSNSTSGGMARVRALRAELERNTPDLLFLHAGDFLGPSFLGRTYAGAHMIDLMNVMDGNPRAGAFDRRMFVAFGNHEFDATHCGKDGPLAGLVTASEFTWLTSNLDFTRCDRLRGLVGNRNIAANRIIESGGLRIGLFAVTLAYPEYAAIVLAPLATACRQIEDLRAKGVDAVVALTHLKWRNDLELLGFGPDGRALPPGHRPCKHAPDVIIGGHDHDSMALPSASPKLFKADADAASAWVVEIEKTGRRPPKIKGRLVQLDGRRPQDPLAQRITDHWLRQHDERFCLNECAGLPGDSGRVCRRAVDGGACLKEAYARAASPIETEEITNRSFETGFGDWLADQVRVAGDADVAFLNGGTIRINQSLPAGTVLTRGHLEQMFPYKDKLITREVQGQALWRAMEHAVAERGEGPWAHFSGMAVQLAEPQSGQKIARILVKRKSGEAVEIGPASTALFKVASSPFLLADGDGHGFKLCPADTSGSKCIEALEAAPNWPLLGEGADIASLVRMNLRKLDPARGLELSTDRRLCDRGQNDCLISRW